MKKRLPLLFLLVLAVTSCSEWTEGNEEKMRLWFQWGTELSLPDDAEFIGGRNNSIFLSDIYLKLKVERSFQTELEKHLERMQSPPKFELPLGMEDWPHWDTNGRSLSFYKMITGDVNKGGFISHLAFDKKSGVLFCHIQEYAP